jgi:hypothetical protein
MAELNPEERYQLRKLQMDVDSRWREIRNLCFYSGSEALTCY